MSRSTKRNNKGEPTQDRHFGSLNKHRRRDRKQFVFRDENWACKSMGGVGNKRAWKLVKDLHRLRETRDRT